MIFLKASDRLLETRDLRDLPAVPKRTSLLPWYQTWSFMASVGKPFPPTPQLQMFKKAIIIIKRNVLISTFSSCRQPAAAARGFIAPNVNLSR